jgi:hypothetical protein
MMTWKDYLIAMAIVAAFFFALFLLGHPVGTW